VDPVHEPTDDELIATDWFAGGRSELVDAFLDEPDAVALLTV
jgi:hypothetical protein